MSAFAAPPSPPGEVPGMEAGFRSPLMSRRKNRRSSLGGAQRVKTPSKAKQKVVAGTDEPSNPADRHPPQSEPRSPRNVPAVMEAVAVASASAGAGMELAPGAPAQRKWTLADFEMGKPLGRGKFGNCYMAREQASQKVVALKVLSKAALRADDAVHTLRREVEIQTRLCHPSILRMHGWFHNEKSAFLILEYAPNGEVFRLLQSSNGRLSEEQTISIMRQLITGIQYMHARFVIHRDIKPENLLLSRGESDRLEVKLADFGWAIHAPPPHDKATTMCGTPEYVAPEILERRPYGCLVDVWALGVLCFELLVGRTPFRASKPGTKRGAAEKNPNEGTFAKILEFQDPLRFPITPLVSPNGKDFVKRLLVREPSKRLRMDSALDHDWLL